MKNSRKMLAIDLLIFVLLLAGDQLTKHIIRIKLELHSYFNVIDKVLQIYHYENRGAVWGILQGKRVFFILMAIVVFFVLVFVILRVPAEKKYIRFNLALMMIAAGAVGNTIDRVMNGSVTDFIYVVLINFPIFNVADMYIVIATFWLVVMILFIYKDEELDFLSLRKKESAESEEEA